jgi:CBS-domain-containing membrane protein
MNAAVPFNRSTGLKYPRHEVTRSLDRHGSIDYAAL